VNTENGRHRRPLRELLRTFESGSRPKGGVKDIREGVPSIGGEHLDRNGGFTFEKIRFVPKQFARSMTRGHLRQGDICVVKDGATTAKVSLVRQDFPYPDAVINEHVFRLEVKPEYDPAYVFYYLYSQSGQQEILSDFRGAAQGGISQRFVDKVSVPVRDVAEQQRIVAEIEKQFTRLDAAVASLKQMQSALRRYRASVLKTGCEGRFVPTEAELARKENRKYETGEEYLQRILRQRCEKWNGRKSYMEPATPVSNMTSILPEGWAQASLDQVFVVERGKFSVRPRNDPRYYDGAHPFVQIGDLPREGGTISRYSQTLNELGLGVSKKFSAGTGLIAIVGATIANTGILSFDSCAPDSLVAFQSRKAVTIRFAELYLRTIKLRLRQSSYASGGQPNINLGTLKPLPIPLPPLAEQERIVEEVERRLSVVDELDIVLSDNDRRAVHLRQSILQQAFGDGFDRTL
jgi:type I restriction enzyme, S subunit